MAKVSILGVGKSIPLSGFRHAVSNIDSEVKNLLGQILEDSCHEDSSTLAVSVGVATSSEGSLCSSGSPPDSGSVLA